MLFCSDGQLRHTETGEPFKFDVKKNDMSYNQLRYEALGEVITEYVYSRLETEVKLKRVYVSRNLSFVYLLLLLAYAVSIFLYRNEIKIINLHP